MKIRSLFLVFGLSVLLLSGLSGCVASAGVGDYGYYPPAPRVYYQPRPIIVAPAPYYRPAYRPHYDAYRGGYGGGHGYYGGGGYHGRRH